MHKDIYFISFISYFKISKLICNQKSGLGRCFWGNSSNFKLHQAEAFCIFIVSHNYIASWLFCLEIFTVTWSFAFLFLGRTLGESSQSCLIYSQMMNHSWFKGIRNKRSFLTSKFQPFCLWWNDGLITFKKRFTDLASLLI